MTDQEIAAAFRDFGDRLMVASEEVGGLRLAAALVYTEADRIERRSEP